jgi:hypothetical protein
MFHGQNSNSSEQEATKKTLHQTKNFFFFSLTLAEMEWGPREQREVITMQCSINTNGGHPN